MLKAKLLGATAGAEEALAIEDVFSTYLYTGNGSTQTITNGIDLAGEGGLVWAKARSLASRSHRLFDTVRGENSALSTDLTNAASLGWDPFFNFTSTGFSFVSLNDGDLNASGSTYASWTFRQAPRFFDVVTYTGTGANRTIAHDLGVVPGCIIVKRTDTTGDWQVYHRSLASTEYLVLNSTAAKATGATRWNSTTPTSSVFSLGTDATVNASGGTYVAYLFAHDPLGPSGDGSDGLIACGGASAASISSPAVVNLGWEPQWILWKNSSVTDNWHIFDTMRGIGSFNTGQVLRANTSGAEATLGDATYPININSTGFSFNPGYFGWGGASNVFTYIAIRRGPMREPTVGTQVFTPLAVPASTSTSVAAPFPPDLVFSKYRTSTTTSSWTDRLRGLAISSANNVATLRSESTAAEALSSHNAYYNNNTFYLDSSSAGVLGYFFRRAPGFFDVVAYTGNGANRTISHNLGAAPELMIVKKRSAVDNWTVYAGDATDYLILNSTAATADLDTMWNDTAPTGSVFSLGTNDDVNGNTATFIAYLFASLPGISKVGSYTGNGSSQTINCAFTTGARFVLIKRTDTTGDWYVWDTARGIVSGNDPHLSLNTTAAEVTSNDTIDPDNSGFIVNQVAATNVNVSSASYIFYAVS